MEENTNIERRSRYTVRRAAGEERGPDPRALVRDGLTRAPKVLSPVLFYDARGSRLFERICALEEYYVCRAEAEILAERSAAIARLAAPEARIVELGSGSSEKTELVLEAMIERSGRAVYVPVDVSEAALSGACERLTRELADLDARAVVGDYADGIALLREIAPAPVLVLFLGGNLGNFEAPGARAFLRDLRGGVSGDDLVLVGLDLVKDPDVLVRAYDDREGVTAEFNKNALRVINRTLGGHFDLDAFSHRAVWNAADSRIEMHLVSERDQVVAIDDLGLEVKLRAGETIHTESSHKYTPAGIDDLAARSGFRVVARWTDRRGAFTDALLAPI